MINDFNDEGKKSVDVRKTLSAKEFTLKRQLEIVDIIHHNKGLVNTFSIYYIKSLKDLLIEYGTFPLLDILHSEYEKKNKGNNDYTTINLENDSAHYLYSRSYDNFYIALSFNPSRGNEKYGNISMSYTINSKNYSDSLVLTYINSVLYVKSKNGDTKIFAKKLLTDFLDNMTEKYIS